MTRRANFRDAAACFEKQLELAQQEPADFAMQGNALSNLGVARCEKARREPDKKKRIDLLNKARANVRGAIRVYTEVLNRGHELARDYLALAVIEWRLGNHDESLESFDKCRRLAEASGDKACREAARNELSGLSHVPSG